MHTKKIIILLSLFLLLPSVIFSAQHVLIHNMTPLTTALSVNNGNFFFIAPYSSNKTLPLFTNRNPSNGQLGIGDNALTIYPRSMGPERSQNFSILVPSNVGEFDRADIVIIPKSSQGYEYNKPGIYFH